MKRSLFKTLLAAALVAVCLLTGASVFAAKDTVVITMNTELATLNPFRAKTGWDYPWMEPLFMRLAELDTEHGEMIPAIGVSWKILDNNTDFMVKLRQDIKFSNGDPVTAEDIKFSYVQYKDRKNAHVGRRIFKYITDVEIKDPTTLIFRMNKPYWDWSGLIRGACFIAPKKYYEAVGPKEFAKKPIGSGAFTLVKRMIGEGATYKVVANHPIYKPQFKTLKFKLVPDATVRVQLLKAGQADLIWGVPPQDYASLKKTKGMKVYSIPYPSLIAKRLRTSCFSARPYPFITSGTPPTRPMTRVSSISMILRRSGPC